MRRSMTAAIMTTLLWICGCSGDPVPPTEAAKASLAEQIEAVRRGVSDEIVISGEGVRGGDWLKLAEAGARLKVLSVEQGELAAEMLAGLAESLPHVARLKLGMRVGNDHLRSVAEFSELKVLNLPQGDFDDAGLRHLQKLEQLELLRFHSRRVSDEGLGIIAAYPSLRFLHVIDTPITDAGLGWIAAMSRLESFYLDGGACTEEGLSELLRNRRDLHFHWNELHLAEDPRKDHP